MPHLRFDNLLQRYLKRAVAEARLAHLENDVWRRIAQRKPQEASNGFERVLAAVFQPEYRFASIAIALTVGLYAGANMVDEPFQQRVGTAEALNFAVFSSQYCPLVSQSITERL